MWQKFQEKHPVLYEIVQWAIMLIALAALIHS